MKEKRALLVVSKRNAKYLTEKLGENGCANIRVIKGRHNSLKVLLSRIQNYKDEDVFIFDSEAVEEKGDELTAALGEIKQALKKATIIYYAPLTLPDNADNILLTRRSISIITHYSDDLKIQLDYEKKEIRNLIANGHSGRKIQIPPEVELSMRKEEEKAQLKGLYNDSKAIIVFDGTGSRSGKTYAAIATALFFRMCNAKIIFLFQNSVELSNFQNYYCPEAREVSNFQGYNGFWYREGTQSEDNLFMSSVDCWDGSENSIDENINFLICDCPTREFNLNTLSQKMITLPILVTSCGFVDDIKAREDLEKLKKGIHAITFGDTARLMDFENDYPEFRHYLIPFLPEITNISKYLTGTCLETFKGAFPPQACRKDTANNI